MPSRFLQSSYNIPVVMNNYLVRRFFESANLLFLDMLQDVLGFRPKILFQRSGPTTCSNSPNTKDK
jgi:hypothetical protein